MFNIEKGVPDEVYVILILYLEIRIYELIDDLTLFQDSYNIKLASANVKDILKLNTSQKVDKAHVSSMSESRRDQPILIACIQNKFWVIDGNHRLMKKEQDGCTECDVILIPNEILYIYCQPLIPGKSDRRKRKQMQEIKDLLGVSS